MRINVSDREILRLAVPAFFALVAEPIFLLADTAIVGHLGTSQLAALGIASQVMGTLVSLCVFLAYGTTASVARRIGAGDQTAALTQGIDGLWLAAFVGAIATVAGYLSTPRLVGLFEPSSSTAHFATTYLLIAWFGAIPLLVMLAATGVLRGMQDTRTPLVVAVVGNLVNIVLNLLFVYGFGWGIAGSAFGTLIAQVGSALALSYVVVRAASTHGAALHPDLPGIKAAATAGVPLIVRTATLRAALILMTYAAARFGDAPLATMQLTMTLWLFLAFVLDAVAIAAQAMTGRYLGAGDVVQARAMTAKVIRWGVVSGVVTGGLLALVSPLIGRVFSSDADVLATVPPVLLVAALAQPLAGLVFVLDGMLIGAGDAKYLAGAGTVVLLVFAPSALLAPNLVWLWVAFCVFFMGGRGLALWTRSRSDSWMRVGGGLGAGK
jgi:putative MATE family efflux protein